MAPLRRFSRRQARAQGFSSRALLATATGSRAVAVMAQPRSRGLTST